jgi:hypothetical protein
MVLDDYPGSGLLSIPVPGVKMHRIPNPDPQRCSLVVVLTYPLQSYFARYLLHGRQQVGTDTVPGTVHL